MLSNRIIDAIQYTVKLHRKQVRKKTRIPYISHLFAVMGIVMENKGTEDEIIAALLHDAVEDQGGQKRLREIREKFGDLVADIVMGCSDTDVKPKPRWKKRKKDYLKHLPNASPSILLVSQADKLHNARMILQDYRQLGDKLWNRFKVGKEEQLWYFKSLVAIYKVNRPTPISKELARVVNELEKLIKKSKRFHKS